MRAAIELELTEPYTSPLSSPEPLSPEPLSPVPDWALDADSPFSSPSPLSPVPDYIADAPGYFDLGLELDLLPPPLIPSLPAAPASHHQAAAGPSEPMTNVERRKKRARGKRAIARQLRSRAAGRGAYDVRTKTVDRYVRPAEGLEVTLNVENLTCTKNGYTGGRCRKDDGKSYGVHELVHKRGMRLVSWDGRYAPSFMRWPFADRTDPQYIHSHSRRGAPGHRRLLRRPC